MSSPTFCSHFRPVTVVTGSTGDRQLTARINAPRSLTDFTIGRPLGKGKFGRVYLARMNAPPHYVVALKSLDKAEIIQGRVEKQVRREIEIQQNLRYVATSPGPLF